MILFLYGEDSFRSRLKMLEYKKRFQKKYGSGGSLTVIDCAEKKDVNFPEIAGSHGLFSPVRLVVIKNLLNQLSNEKQEEIREFLKSNKNIAISKEAVIVFWEEDEPKKTNALFKYFQKNAKLERFEKLEGIKLNRWIETRLKEINPKAKISRLAIEKLIVYTTGDTEHINNELCKLANYKDKINEDDVDRLVSARLSSNIFETIENASAGNKKKALLLLHQQLENKEDPFYILSMYAYQFRNLLKIGEYYWKGLNDRFSISQKTGLHPYVIQKSLPQLRNLSLVKLKDAFSRIQKIDLEAKTGKMDISLALDKFLVEL